MIEKKLINDGSLSPSQICEITDHIGLKVKVYFIHDMPNIDSLPNGNYIILITPNKNIYSGHYVCMKIFNSRDITNEIGESRTIAYFDSYGMPPPKKISSTKSSIVYNTDQIQSLSMNHCGQFCIGFLKSVNLAKSIKSFIKKANNYTSNFMKL